jgi:hypothetical protein
MGGFFGRVAMAAGLLVAGMMAGAIPVGADAGAPWNPGPGAVGDDTYTGFIDVPAQGATLTPNAMVVVQGWVVDRTAMGWSGVDSVEVYLGLRDQGGTLMNTATVGLRRADVASALNNPYWAASGFSTSFAQSGLTPGSNTLSVYAHTPDKGWWYRQVQVTLPAAPARAFADDPLLVVREASPSLDVAQSTPTLTLTGYAIDRNLPPNQQLGAGGSGVSSVEAFLDGPRAGSATAGSLIATATLGLKNREATGFGERFLMSGWQLTIHPTDLTVEPHELFIYAESAYWPSETLVVVPFTVH